MSKNEIIKEGRKILCPASGEFANVGLETARAWLTEAKAAGITPSVREDEGTIVRLYELDKTRSVLTHEYKIK